MFPNIVIIVFVILVTISAIGPGIALFILLRNRRIGDGGREKPKSNTLPVKSDNLKELERLRTAFYTNITHEFRTPLTVISGMASMIEENPADTSEAVDMIKRNSSSLLTLVNQMLDLSKLDAGAMKVNMIQGDVTTYINYIVETLTSFAMQEGITLDCQHEHSPFEMDYDAEKLMHVISNLVANGIKFTPEDGKVEVWTHMTKAGGVEQFHISVRDTGIGIGREHIPYIFSRFYRVEDTALKTSKGTGVGLALTKDLVELMNGEIDVRSATGQGATFVVTLPVTRIALPDTYDVEPDEIRLASDAYVSGQAPKATAAETAIVDTDIPLVLVIEDSPDVAKFIGKSLKSKYRVDYAADGEEGIEKALELIPDVVVTDVMMPKKDGFEVCDTLKKDERTSHIPIIVLTAKADMGSKLEGLETGADAYMSKPFEQEELLVRIRKLLELRKALQKRYGSGQFIEDAQDGAHIEDAFIQKLTDVVRDNLDDADFGSVHLARAMTLSRSQLHNKIKALTGRSTAIYIRYIRLLESKRLLKDPELNVSEVAYDVGFKDPAYFTRCFKEEFGMSPTEYRED